MLYLNERSIREVGINWEQLVDTIEGAVRCLGAKDFAQPVKPYLRYRDLKNRIIAMPAFVGGEFDIAGIKWIASFPDNIHSRIPRAHSVVVLNKADTGQPVGIINTALLSILRTASVSGLMVRNFNKVRPISNANLGIIGWGPIGQHQLKMCLGLLGDRINKITLYDLRLIDKSAIDFAPQDKIVIADSWEEAYEDADIFITSTVSKAPYIDKAPKPGSLQLNVSLRDFKTDIYDYVKNSIIVDDWEEICREKTDIEMMHLDKGLNEEDTKSIVDMVMHDCMEQYPADAPIMFNPMGMAVFDMAVGAYYLREARKRGIGQNLE
ncbi:MAG: 2,3-diaminopropionate biosynthesis protein SbnB [bacterium]|nr:2,3-diaminopropionate biosynthesis protein SbnB [bacterium]